LTSIEFDQLVEHYHLVLNEFAKGDPKPVIALLSRKDDVTLAGGFGGVTRGGEQVRKNIEVAATQFKEGQIIFENLGKYSTEDLGYIVEIERYQAKLSGGKNMSQNPIRCTSIFRREEGVWKLVHRHGDPLQAMRALLQAVTETVVSIQKAV